MDPREIPGRILLVCGPQRIMGERLGLIVVMALETARRG